MTKYTTGERIGSISNATKVAFDFPQNFLLKNAKKSSPIILFQAPVESNFNLKAFLEALYSTTVMSTKEIPVAIAKDQKAYLLEDPSNEGQRFSPKFIFFITPDNVLIHVGTATATQEDLLQLAESLK